MEQVVQITDEDQAIINAKLDRKREVGRLAASVYRAKNKALISDINRAYFAKNKTNPEFMAKHHASIKKSILKRQLENKKPDGIPVRPYIRQPIPIPSCLGESEIPQN
jgi:hypothetical protein